ncbi:putative multidrug resistance protein [Wolffia australiana]
MAKKEEGGEGERTGSTRASSIWTLFMHADAVDMWLMCLGLLGSLADGFSLPAMLIITSKIMNNLGKTTGVAGDVSSFINIVSDNARIMLYLALGTGLASFFEGFCWTRTGERQAARMRATYLRAVLRQDIEYFDLQVDNTAQVVTSVSSDSLVIQDVLSEKVPNFIMNAATFFGSYVAALVLMWRLAVSALPTFFLLIIPGIMYGRILMGLVSKIREEYDKAGNIAEQAISAIRTVYSFVGESKTMKEFSAALEGSVKLGLRQGLTKGIAIGINSVTYAIWAFLSWYGSRLVMYHGGEGGTVFAVGAAVIIGGLSLGSGLSNVKYLSEAVVAGERIKRIIKRTPKIDSEDDSGEVIGDVKGDVELRGVEFAYPSRPETLIFKSFHLRVPAGTTMALVGGSGSGKSTVISLLQRFYDPKGGQVFLDGVDIRRLQLKWLRSQMGLVSQEPALFATSIKENILFGKEDATMDEVIEAAKAANAHSFISQLPLGYDTQVGERGVQMSGGQKQRIAIARAVIKTPKILLLDEATSALDSECERLVQEALDAAAVGRTTIVIAHRLSTVRNATVIAVIQDGQVVEAGSHDELVRHPTGAYASLERLQLSSEESTSSPAAGPWRTLSSRSGRGLDRSSRSLSFRGSSSSFGEVQLEAETEPKTLPVPSFKRLLMMNAPEWKQASVGVASAAVFGAIQPAYAFALGSVISVYFLTDHDEIKSSIRTYSLIFVGLFVLSFSINVCQHYCFAFMGEQLTKRVRERMLSKILTFEVGWFDQDENSTGAICARLSKDASVVRSLVGDRMSLVVQTLSAVIVACTMGLVIAWRLALVMIAVQPIIIVSFYARRVLLKKMSAKLAKSQGESGKLAAEAVSNVRTITAFSSQDRILKLFEAAQEGPGREAKRQSWYAGLGLGISQCLMICTWALDFWYGGLLIRQGDITAKALFQTFMILVSTGRVIADAGSMTTDLAKGADAVGSVFAVLDRCTAIEAADPDAHKPKTLTGQIEFRAVVFAYPARPDVTIFNGFSIVISPGRSTALVGQSGSGKSTVIALIERFYDPAKGTVLIDGRDVRTYHLRELRRHVALVGQEPTLFAGTIRDNIVYGAEEATQAEVEEAARTANAHDFISALKDGYDTCCGDRGVQLSGGQKQRIAIARAVLKSPAVLLLDEATSALDFQSERMVQEALERVMVGRTSVVVAHRLSTIKNCDMIAVLDKGRVVEKGTHASLLAKGQSGTYFSLVSLQQGLKSNGN